MTRRAGNTRGGPSLELRYASGFRAASGLPHPRMARRAEPHHTTPAARVTISVVSHGHGHYVRQILLDLEKAAARIDKVIVTRNVPEADVLSGLALSFPLEFIDNAQPRGFGANHNAAFRHCGSPWFLVLNPDVRIGPEAIATLLDEAAPTSGVVAPRVMEPGKAAPEPHRGHLTPFEIMGRWVRRDNDRAQPQWVAGMFMLFRSAAYGRVGGFDEKFFMYVEDADICARLRLAGWDVTVNEAVRILHDAQRASDHHWQHLAWHWASLLRWWASSPFWRLVFARGPSAPLPVSGQPATASQSARRE
ncbi:MAG TPA: glycosyltransferase family 2 protein [Ramlibacter sp.]|uniref:glycosyltransferase family 2 protein n=1 Tax=Ramlibacter sp. TaxID=1917967 RepID=UPI002D80F692|nr:glycosyltransferase family 2 protein [Ramlibacter sp.]HET8744046.1 glycosyltransferase family 2 protein [Ramlibacter sp.]